MCRDVVLNVLLIILLHAYATTNKGGNLAEIFQQKANMRKNLHAMMMLIYVLLHVNSLIEQIVYTCATVAQHNSNIYSMTSFSLPKR